MKALKIVVGVIAVIVVGLIVFALTFDANRYKGAIEAQAKAATGRDVAIGNIGLSLSLHPGLALRDVTVANASWGTGPNILSIKRIDVSTDLLPLLSGHVNINSLDLADGQVLLETGKQGQENWQFATAQPASSQASSSQQQSLNIGAIKGSNLSVEIRDGRTGSDITAAVKDVAVAISGPLQDLDISKLTMTDVTAGRKTGNETIEATIGKVTLEGSGKLADLAIRTLEMDDAKVSDTGAGAPLTAAVSKLQLGGDGALDLEASYNGQDIKAKGTIAPPASFKDGVRTVPVKVTLEGLGLKGDVDLTVDVTQTPPMAKGSISIPQIDLARFAGGSDSKPAPRGTAAAPGRMFADAPLPWSDLDLANADVKLSVGEIKLAQGGSLSNVSLPVVLEKGRLTITGASADLAGGRIGGDITANAGDKAVTAKMNAKGLTAEALARLFHHGDLITGGPLDLAVDVHGSGNSAHAIAASLGGSIVGGMGGSHISNKALGPGVSQILALVNPVGANEPDTVGKCAAVNFRISNGVADTENGVALVTDKFNLVGSGKIDLGPESIDMMIKPTVSGLIGSPLGNVVSAIHVSGSLADPKIGADKASTMKGLATLGAAFATGGTSIFGQALINKVHPSGGGGDPCQVARTWTAKH